MGLGGISMPQLMIVLLIVVLLFGTRRLRGIGTDLGGAVKSFRNEMQDEPAPASEALADADAPESLPALEQHASQPERV